MPTTRAFGLKRFIARLCGIRVETGSKICGDVAVYGAGKVEIGSNCWIGIGCAIFASENTTVKIGDRCDLAPQVVIHTGTHEIGDKRHRAGPGFAEGVVIGSGTWIGVRTTILHGVNLKGGNVIAAGSVVIRGDYEADTLMGGTPAKVLRGLAL